MKHLKKFKLIKESGPIAEVEYKFEKTKEYSAAFKETQKIIDELEVKFYEWCENNGHEGAEGDTDYEMTFNNICIELVSKYR